MSVVEQTRKQLLRERRTTAIESLNTLPTGVVCLSNAPAGEAEYSRQRHGLCREALLADRGAPPGLTAYRPTRESGLQLRNPKRSSNEGKGLGNFRSVLLP